MLYILSYLFVHKHAMYLRATPVTILGYELSQKENAVYYYLIPYCSTLILYVLHFSCDVTLGYEYIRNGEKLYGCLTLAFVGLPSMVGLLGTICNRSLWPYDRLFDANNFKWMGKKVLEHTLFPVWTMHRYAEKIFWSIEAVRSTKDEEIAEALQQTERKSAWELYAFLQAYFQAIPQLLLQFHVIFRIQFPFQTNILIGQALSIVMSLTKVAHTTTIYQRFKSQKITGRSYGWMKMRGVVIAASKWKFFEAENNALSGPTFGIERNNRNEGTDVERADDDDEEEEEEFEEPISLHPEKRPISVVDVEKRSVYVDETDFSIPKAVEFIKGLPQDDLAGKIVSFMWWFSFLTSRLLCLAAFGYFYKFDIYYICLTHILIMFAFILYDAKIENKIRANAPYAIFLAYIYLFCLIELKVKFSRPAVIYKGYFAFMFTEHFVLTFIWFLGQDLEHRWWFNYVFYMIIVTTSLTLMSMCFYFVFLKPKRVVLSKIERDSTFK